MRTQHARRFSRRRFLGGLTVAGMGGFLGLTPRRVAAEPPPETPRLRVMQGPALCEAPIQVAQELLQGEGFSDIQYIRVPTSSYESLAAGEIDLALHTAQSGLRRIEAGDPIVILAGVHVGCFELFGHEHVRTIRDLKDKVVVVPRLGGGPHTLVAIMAAYVGLDPQKDITWAVPERGREAMQFFIDGKADAFMGLPPETQVLRARKIGHVVVNTTTDRPWSQYFCCMVYAHRAFVRNHPSATKRAIRAILKASEVCALEPETTAQLLVDRGYMVGRGSMVDRGYTDSYDLALAMVKEIPYGQWRQYDAEDTVRFFALRLREAGLIKATPQQIMAQGTDWRFLNELKKEMKG
jgi:NitT/TauT family transport system substrate-binding protein